VRGDGQGTRADGAAAAAWLACDSARSAGRCVPSPSHGQTRSAASGRDTHWHLEERRPSRRRYTGPSPVASAGPGGASPGPGARCERSAGRGRQAGPVLQ
jgi:hypothetical protein